MLTYILGYAGGGVTVSELFDPQVWREVAGFDDLTDITYHLDVTGRIARIAFDRPEVRNAFRPQTVDELYRALDDARQNPRIGVVLLTGNGPSPKDGGWAFCSGGDQRIRGRDGYEYERRSTGRLDHRRRGAACTSSRCSGSSASCPRSSSRSSPAGRPAAATRCTWSATSRSRAASTRRFKQTDADVGSFDAGYGSAYFARQVGQKFAREVFFLAQEYDAERALEMGAINAVVPHAELETDGVDWAETILGKSPDRDPHAQVRLQRRRRRDGRPAGVRGRGDPARLRHRRSGRGARRVPREARRPTGRPTPGSSEPMTRALVRRGCCGGSRRGARRRCGTRSPAAAP